MISKRLAGRIRYMDCKEEEQKRGITMKSSMVSLVISHKFVKVKDMLQEQEHSETLNNADKYLINVIDSPGHVDFCTDMISAVKLSDGAYLVVDVIEGVCSQTVQAMRIAIEHKVSLCLVVNKIDRLFLEKMYTPIEAYEHLLRLIEQTNSILSSFLEQDDDSQLFSPVKGNVLFCCAYDNWAFSLRDFVIFVRNILPKKYPPRVILKAMWGPYFVSKKDGQIKVTKDVVAAESLSGSYQNLTNVPIFVRYVLKPVRDIYTNLLVDFNASYLLKMAQVLEVTQVLNEKSLAEAKSDGQRRTLLQKVFDVWLPFGKAFFGVAISKLASPISSTYDGLLSVKQVTEFTKAITTSIKDCSSNAELAIAQVIKTISISRAMLSAELVSKIESFDGFSNENEIGGEIFFSIVRVYSGIFSEKTLFDINNESKQVASGCNTLIFRLLGPDLCLVDQACAGNIVAVYGVSKYCTSSVTFISSNREHICLEPVLKQLPCLVRVALQLVKNKDLSTLLTGLKWLKRVNQGIDVVIETTGEYVIGAVGELQLETCINQLKKKISGVDFTVSSPLVSFKETLVWKEKSAQEDSVEEFLRRICTKEDMAYRKKFTDDFIITLSVLPLPEQCDHKIFRSNFSHVRMVRSNILISNCLSESDAYFSSILSGFDLACEKGPLCAEPLWECLIIINEIDASESFSGEAGIIIFFKEAIHEAIMVHAESEVSRCEVRLVESMFRCNLVCSQEGLGRLFAILSKRRADIISEDLVTNSTTIFAICVKIPVAESFGFAGELRSTTSGAASVPQLTFDGWQILDQNPFYKPTSKEDLEDHGNLTKQEILKQNVARRLLLQQRKSKGLLTEEKIVVDAEKQRTLSRKK